MSTQVLEKPVDRTVGANTVTLSNIGWSHFKAIEACFQGIRGVKLSYLAGVLEIMSPISRQHERIKKTLGYLLETYMRETGIRFYGCGSFTLESPGYASNEPDESYCIGSYKEIPDIAIEVIVTSGTLNRLELYKPKGIPEVWFWKSDQLTLFRWQEGRYQEVKRSQFFPELDLDLLLRYVGYPDQYDAVKAFQEAIRRRKD